MVSERDRVLAALSAEATSLENALSGLSEREAVYTTRCPPWDVAALAVHTVGSLYQTTVALEGPSPAAAEVSVSAFGYYRPEVRFSPEVNRARVESAVEKAARRSDAGEPGRVLGRVRREPSARLAVEPLDRAVRTRHGDAMTLTDYLVTRVMELSLHGLDLADALGRDPWISPEGLVLVRDVLFGAADRDALERVLPGVWDGGEATVAAVRAVTGRSSERVERSVLEAAGARLPALG